MLQSHQAAGWSSGDCTWATEEGCGRAVVSGPWPPSDMSAWKQESPVSSAFWGGPGLGESLNEHEALRGVDGDAWETC